MKNRILCITIALIMALTLSFNCSFAAETQNVQGLKASTVTFQQIQLEWNPVLMEAPVQEDIQGEPSEEDTDITAEESDDTDIQESEEEPPAKIEAVLEYQQVTYLIYRATSKKGSYKKIASTSDTSYTDCGLTPGKTYYYKVKAKGETTETGYSAIVSAKVIKEKSAALSLLEIDGQPFNVREAAGEKLYEYDTIQGLCANDGIGYFSLYNRKVEKCKIVKARLSDMTVLQVSAPLKVYHANSLTYNTRKNIIVAACCMGKPKCVCTIDPETLTLISTKTVSVSKGVKGISSKVKKGYKGINAIAYNEAHDCYYARLKKYGNYIRLDGNLTPVKYVSASSKKSYLLYQAIETYGDYIYDVQSFKGKHKYSMVTVRTLSGKYAGQMKFPYVKKPGYELECIFHDGDQFYAGFYYSTSQVDDTQAKHVNRTNYIYRVFNQL